MPQRRVVELQFPLGGIERRFAYQSQPPYTTPDALNVRPWDPILRRERGGSRVGVERLVRTKFGSGSGGLRALDAFRYSVMDGFTIFSDDFAQGLSTDWSAQFGTDLPTVTDGIAECADGDTVTAVHTAMDFSYSGAMPDAGLTVEVLILPDAGKYQGTYRLFLYLDDTSPDKAQACFELEITTANGTALTGHIRCMDAGVESWKQTFSWTPTVVDAGWLRLSHLPGRYPSPSDGHVVVTFRGRTLKYISSTKVPPVGTAQSTLDGSPVKDNGTSTVTVDDPIFEAWMVGRTLAVTGGSSYSIASVTDTTHCVVTGDASGEADGATVIIRARAHRWGFEMVSSQGGIGKVERARFHYGHEDGHRSMRYGLIGIADGQVWLEHIHYALEQARMPETGINYTINRDVFPMTTSVGGRLYIADHGGLAAREADSTLAEVDTTQADNFIWLRWKQDGTNWVTWSTFFGSEDLRDYGVFLDTVPSGFASGSYRAEEVDSSGTKLKLYRSETTDHGFGACTFFLARTAKLATYVSGEKRMRLSAWGGSALGTSYIYPLYLPIGFSILAKYCDRMIVSGDPLAPYVVYMSRVNSEDDWDYSQTDSEAAVAISLLGFGNLEVTAVIPFADDYLLIGCRTSLWVQRGDPKYQGTLQNLSRNVGVVGPEAWAWLPDGRLVFLSHMGLYELQPGASSYPRPLSPDRLPSELKGVNKDTHRAVLAYDPVEEGVLITVSPIDYAASTVTHWWFDPRREAFWRDELPRDIDPVCPLRGAFQKLDPPGLLYGGRDGYVYHRALHRISDADTAIATNAIYGPLRLGRSPLHEGVLQELEAQLGTDSDGVTWAVQVAATAQASVDATALVSGSFNGGDNYTARPRARGRAACVKLSSSASARWAIEALTAVIGTAGRHRKP